MDCCSDVRGAECHCAQCHATWRGMELFDAHQDADYDREPKVICRRPEDLRVSASGHPVMARPGVGELLRLVQDSRGTWCTPGGLQASQRRPPVMKAKTG